MASLRAAIRPRLPIDPRDPGRADRSIQSTFPTCTSSLRGWPALYSASTRARAALRTATRGDEGRAIVVLDTMAAARAPRAEGAQPDLELSGLFKRFGSVA